LIHIEHRSVGSGRGRPERAVTLAAQITPGRRLGTHRQNLDISETNKSFSSRSEVFSPKIRSSSIAGIARIDGLFYWILISIRNTRECPCKSGRISR
jgi:hypothetical protein